jgi:predicted Zn-dependent peptidase
MTNLREEKGYTYGIGSIVVSMLKSGYLVIISEVGKDLEDKAVIEINNELKKIRTEIIPDDELLTVKNYMLGELLNAFDGPFALAESFKSILDYNLDYDYFEKYINTIKNITSEELIKLANKYIHEENMIGVIAGAKHST